MDYRNTYNNIINRAEERTTDTYTEQHHVIPLCVGGADSDNNIVELTAREHFICHWLLHRMYPNNKKLAYAFHIMCSDKHNHRYTPSSRTIAEAREAQSFARKGTTHSEKTKEKISKGVRLAYKEGQIDREYNITEITKQRMSDAKLGADRPDEHRKAISEGRKDIATGKDHWAYGGWSDKQKKEFNKQIKYISQNKDKIYNKAKQLYDSGTPMTEIANQVTVSRQTLYNWKNKFNWTR